MKRLMLHTVVLSTCLMAAGLAVDTLFDTRFVIPEADARVGRPATPISVAGVARRSTRRVVRRTVVRRSTIYVATLPRGCTTIRMDGMTLQQCGRTYYQPYGSQWVEVTVN